MRKLDSDAMKWSFHLLHKIIKRKIIIKFNNMVYIFFTVYLKKSDRRQP